VFGSTPTHDDRPESGWRVLCPSTTIRDRMFCRKCRYRLSSWQTCCPECGRAFDPGDPQTYLRSPRRLMRRALIGWLYLSPLIGTAGPLYVLGLAHTIARPRENLPRSMYDLVFPLHICGGRVLADATGISTGASCCLGHCSGWRCFCWCRGSAFARCPCCFTWARYVFCGTSASGRSRFPRFELRHVARPHYA